MKLSALLSQNIRKGSNDLLRVLRQEADNEITAAVLNDLAPYDRLRADPLRQRHNLFISAALLPLSQHLLYVQEEVFDYLLEERRLTEEELEKSYAESAALLPGVILNGNAGL